MGISTRDSYVLTSPQGSTYDLASWIIAEDGPDFGDSWMVQRYVENAANDGAQFSFESAGVRTMSFPLLVASSTFGGLPGSNELLKTEAQLRFAARPGATLDIRPAGYDTSNPDVRFDVIGGRWKPAYRLREQAISIRRGVLELDVQPFGYWPTDIILASAASVGLPGSASFTGLQGDIPGLAKLTIIPTLPTVFPAGTWLPDFVAWAIHGQGASFRALYPAGSIATVGAGSPSITADAFAISSQAYETVGGVNWTPVGAAIIPADLEPAYRGRHRLWALAKLTPSQGLPFYVSADVVIGKARAEVVVVHMASAAPIATLYPALASGTPDGAWAAASPAYQLLDLGEITLPPVASGHSFQQWIRLWTKAATTTLPVATPYIRFDSLWLQSLPMAGVLPQRLSLESQAVIFGTASEPPGLAVDSYTGRLYSFRSDASQSTIREVSGDYRGLMPQVGASTLRLEVLSYSRHLDATTSLPVARTAAGYAPVSLTYRPRFAFVRGL